MPQKSADAAGKPAAKNAKNAATKPRSRYLSLDSAVQTELLTLTPDFLDAVRKIAPKKRRSKIPYIVAGTVLVILGALGADRSTREFAIGKGREVAANVKAAEPTVGAAPDKPVATAAPAAPEQAEATVQVPVVSIAPLDSALLNAAPPATARSEEPPPPVATGAKKAPAVQSKKSQPRSAVRPATQGRTET
jgi:hypothetical protein